MGLTASIDLSQGTVSLAPTPADELRRFLGGRGRAAWLLSRYQAVAAAGPLGPAAPLILSTGPLTGTAWPTSARGHITFHSPLTGLYGYANSGGHFWAALAQAGFDAVVVTGRSPAPCWLDVTPGAIAIRSAEELWGLETGETTRRLSAGDSSARVLCIGPAGEKGVLIAGFINDGSRAAARCGGGAVAGSKQLKAVVVRGARATPAPPEFTRVAGEAGRRLKAAPGTQGLQRFGTPVLMAPKNASGDLPARNHQAGQIAQIRQIDAEALQHYVVRHRGCHACPIRCDHVTRVEEGPYAGELGGPEYETLDALGPMVGLADLPAIMHANRRCNELGLDTISTGVAIAFAMECHQRGLLDDPNLSLAWGDAESVLGLIERIARREGLGALLAGGVRAAAERLGPAAQPFAMHVKGLEIPRQEPRIAKGFGLGHAVSNRGADHLYALPTVDVAGAWDTARRLFPAEVVPQLMDTADETYKPDLVVPSEHYSAISDALGVCKFSTCETWALMPADLAAGLAALTGEEWDAASLLAAGERIVNLERQYNVRLGVAGEADTLPARFTQEPLDIYAFDQDGNRSAEPVRRGALLQLAPMLQRYYALRGWDAQGRPMAETLERLGLGELVGAGGNS